jgi:large subunit ribosomal protein L6
MSERKIHVLDGADVSINGLNITVKGPKGTLTKDFNNPKFMKSVTITKNGSDVIIKENKDIKKTMAIVGTIAAHLRNMMNGVVTGYKYNMKIIYTHFPITVAVKDKEVQVKNFLGEKGVRTSEIVGNTQVKVEKDTVSVSGINLDEVSQTAANIELSCKLRKRDRRIFVDGVYVSEKLLQSGEKI